MYRVNGMPFVVQNTLCHTVGTPWTIRTDPEKDERIRNWQQEEKVEEVSVEDSC